MEVSLPAQPLDCRRDRRHGYVRLGTCSRRGSATGRPHYGVSVGRQHGRDRGTEDLHPCAIRYEQVPAGRLQASASRRRGIPALCRIVRRERQRNQCDHLRLLLVGYPCYLRLARCLQYGIRRQVIYGFSQFSEHQAQRPFGAERTHRDRPARRTGGQDI